MSKPESTLGRDEEYRELLERKTVLQQSLRATQVEFNALIREIKFYNDYQHSLLRREVQAVRDLPDSLRHVTLIKKTTTPRRTKTKKSAGKVVKKKKDEKGLNKSSNKKLSKGKKEHKRSKSQESFLTPLSNKSDTVEAILNQNGTENVADETDDDGKANALPAKPSKPKAHHTKPKTPSVGKGGMSTTSKSPPLKVTPPTAHKAPPNKLKAPPTHSKTPPTHSKAPPTSSSSNVSTPTSTKAASTSFDKFIEGGRHNYNELLKHFGEPHSKSVVRNKPSSKERSASTTNKATSSLPKATASLPKAASSLPKATASLPKAASSLPKATASLPKAASTVAKATSPPPTGPPYFYGNNIRQPHAPGGCRAPVGHDVQLFTVLDTSVNPPRPRYVASIVPEATAMLPLGNYAGYPGVPYLPQTSSAHTSSAHTTATASVISKTSSVAVHGKSSSTATTASETVPEVHTKKQVNTSKQKTSASVLSNVDKSQNNTYMCDQVGCKEFFSQLQLLNLHKFSVHGTALRSKSSTVQRDEVKSVGLPSSQTADDAQQVSGKKVSVGEKRGQKCSNKESEEGRPNPKYIKLDFNLSRTPARTSSVANPPKNFARKSTGGSRLMKRRKVAIKDVQLQLKKVRVSIVEKAQDEDSKLASAKPQRTQPMGHTKATLDRYRYKNLELFRDHIRTKLNLSTLDNYMELETASSSTCTSQDEGMDDDNASIDSTEEICSRVEPFIGNCARTKAFKPEIFKPLKLRAEDPIVSLSSSPSLSSIADSLPSSAESQLSENETFPAVSERSRKVRSQPVKNKHKATSTKVRSKSITSPRPMDASTALATPLQRPLEKSLSKETAMERVETSSPECEKVQTETRINIGASTSSAGVNSTSVSSPPANDEYSVRLLQTIAKLSAEIEGSKSRTSSLCSPPPVIELSSDSEEEEEEEPCTSLVVNIDLSKLSRVPVPLPCPSLTEVNVVTQHVGSFTSQGVQVERGLILDKDVLDSYLTVKVGEALYEMRSKLERTERRVREVMKEKERLEKLLETKLRLIKDLTTTDLKPVFSDKCIMTDPVDVLSRKKTKHQLHVLKTALSQMRSRCANPEETETASECLSELGDKELEEFLRVSPDISSNPPPESDGEDEGVLLTSKNQWMFESSDSARSSAFNLQVRFMRALTQDQTSSEGQSSSTSNVVSPSKIVSPTLLSRDFCLSFAKIQRINQQLKALPLASVLKEKVLVLTSSISHLLSHLPLSNGTKEVAYDDIILLMRLSIGGAAYNAGWKIKELHNLLRSVESTNLPAYFKAELNQVTKFTQKCLDYSVTGMRNVTVDHGKVPSATHVTTGSGYVPMDLDDLDLDDLLSSSDEEEDTEVANYFNERDLAEVSSSSGRLDKAGESGNKGGSSKYKNNRSHTKKNEVLRKSEPMKPKPTKRQTHIMRKGGRFCKRNVKGATPVFISEKTAASKTARNEKSSPKTGKESVVSPSKRFIASPPSHLSPTPSLREVPITTTMCAATNTTAVCSEASPSDKNDRLLSQGVNLSKNNLSDSLKVLNSFVSQKTPPVVSTVTSSPSVPVPIKSPVTTTIKSPVTTTIKSPTSSTFLSTLGTPQQVGVRCVTHTSVSSNQVTPLVLPNLINPHVSPALPYGGRVSTALSLPRVLPVATVPTVPRVPRVPFPLAQTLPPQVGNQLNTYINAAQQYLLSQLSSVPVGASPHTSTRLPLILQRSNPYASAFAQRHHPLAIPMTTPPPCYPAAAVPVISPPVTKRRSSGVPTVPVVVPSNQIAPKVASPTITALSNQMPPSVASILPIMASSNQVSVTSSHSPIVASTNQTPSSVSTTSTNSEVSASNNVASTPPITATSNQMPPSTVTMSTPPITAPSNQMPPSTVTTSTPTPITATFNQMPPWTITSSTLPSSTTSNHISSCSLDESLPSTVTYTSAATKLSPSVSISSDVPYPVTTVIAFPKVSGPTPQSSSSSLSPVITGSSSPQLSVNKESTNSVSGSTPPSSLASLLISGSFPSRIGSVSVTMETNNSATPSPSSSSSTVNTGSSSSSVSVTTETTNSVSGSTPPSSSSVITGSSSSLLGPVSVTMETTSSVSVPTPSPSMSSSSMITGASSSQPSVTKETTNYSAADSLDKSPSAAVEVARPLENTPTVSTSAGQWQTVLDTQPPLSADDTAPPPPLPSLAASVSTKNSKNISQEVSKSTSSSQDREACVTTAQSVEMGVASSVAASCPTVVAGPLLGSNPHAVSIPPHLAAAWSSIFKVQAPPTATPPTSQRGNVALMHLDLQRLFAQSLMQRAAAKNSGGVNVLPAMLGNAYQANRGIGSSVGPSLSANPGYISTNPAIPIGNILQLLEQQKLAAALAEVRGQSSSTPLVPSPASSFTPSTSAVDTISTSLLTTAATTTAMNQTVVTPTSLTSVSVSSVSVATPPLSRQATLTCKPVSDVSGKHLPSRVVVPANSGATSSTIANQMQSGCISVSQESPLPSPTPSSAPLPQAPPPPLVIADSAPLEASTQTGGTREKSKAAAGAPTQPPLTHTTVSTTQKAGSNSVTTQELSSHTPSLPLKTTASNTEEDNSVIYVADKSPPPPTTTTVPPAQVNMAATSQQLLPLPSLPPGVSSLPPVSSAAAVSSPSLSQKSTLSKAKSLSRKSTSSTPKASSKSSAASKTSHTPKSTHKGSRISSKSTSTATADAKKVGRVSSKSSSTTTAATKKVPKSSKSTSSTSPRANSVPPKSTSPAGKVNSVTRKSTPPAIKKRSRSLKTASSVSRSNSLPPKSNSTTPKASPLTKKSSTAALKRSPLVSKSASASTPKASPLSTNLTATKTPSLPHKSTTTTTTTPSTNSLPPESTVTAPKVFSLSSLPPISHASSLPTKTTSCLTSKTNTAASEENTANDLTVQSASPSPVETRLPVGVNPFDVTPVVQVLHDTKGILIKWTFPKKYINLQVGVRVYELYAYIIKNGSEEFPPISQWSKVGSIPPLKLPMAVTLSNVMKTKKYVFSVRAVFDERLSITSQFSKPSGLREDSS